MIEAAFIGTFVPVLLLVFVLRHSRPVMLALCWGMCTFLIVRWLVPTLEPLVGLQGDVQRSAVIFGPPVEEILKALPLLIYFMFIAPKSFIPYIYIFGMAVGIGFGIEENLMHLLLNEDPSWTRTLMILRSFSTCIMHGTMTAIVGIAVTHYRRNGGLAVMMPFLAIGLASVLHSLFNYSVFAGSQVPLYRALYLACPIILFFFGVMIVRKIERHAPETEGTEWEEVHFRKDSNS